MVVVEPGSERDNKAQQQPLLGQQQPAPAYNAAAPGPSGTVPPQHAWSAPPVFLVERPESAAKRFFKAFLVAVLVWLLMSAFFASVTDCGLRPVKFTLVRRLTTVVARFSFFRSSIALPPPVSPSHLPLPTSLDSIVAHGVWLPRASPYARRQPTVLHSPRARPRHPQSSSPARHPPG